MSYTQGTREYSELVSYIESVCSVKFNASDLDRVKNLINQAIKVLYDRYPFWSRYIGVSEPRHVRGGYISPVEDSIIVTDAPNSSFNGLYYKRDNFWVMVGSDHTHYKFIGYDPGGTIIAEGNYVASTYDVAYRASEISGDISTYTWLQESDGGMVDLYAYKTSDVNQFIHVRDQPLGDNCTIGRAVPFVVDNRGAKILGGFGNRDVLYLTYKKPLENRFGTESGEITKVPSEFFEYTALHAARMYNLSKQVNTDPQVRNITLREIEDAAMPQLMIQERNNPDFVQRITHTNF